MGRRVDRKVKGDRSSAVDQRGNIFVELVWRAVARRRFGFFALRMATPTLFAFESKAVSSHRTPN
jgi:hypothetical protein